MAEQPDWAKYITEYDADSFITAPELDQMMNYGTVDEIDEGYGTGTGSLGSLSPSNPITANTGVGLGGLDFSKLGDTFKGLLGKDSIMGSPGMGNVLGLGNLLLTLDGRSDKKRYNNKLIESMDQNLTDARTNAAVEKNYRNSYGVKI